MVERVACLFFVLIFGHRGQDGGQGPGQGQKRRPTSSTASMSTSRYSSKAHQRDRQALFSAEDLSPSPSPMATPTPMPITITSMEAGQTAAPSAVALSSPYGPSGGSKQRGGYSSSAHEMAQLESQSEETVSLMKDKIGALRELSVAMGTEINKSKRNLVELGEDMGVSSERIRYNMNRMRRFVERSGVGWKVWLGFAAVVMWCFLWVWLF